MTLRIVTFIERDIFLEVDEDEIIETLMSFRKQWLRTRMIKSLYVNIFQTINIAFELFIL
jgi:hypothetical protein